LDELHPFHATKYSLEIIHSPKSEVKLVLILYMFDHLAPSGRLLCRQRYLRLWDEYGHAEFDYCTSLPCSCCPSSIHPKVKIGTIKKRNQTYQKKLKKKIQKFIKTIAPSPPKPSGMITLFQPPLSLVNGEVTKSVQ